MNITIHNFAILSEYFGHKITLDLQSPYHADQIISKLAKMKPEATKVLQRTRVAVNQQIVDISSIELKKHDEIALLPPSSGG